MMLLHSLFQVPALSGITTGSTLKESVKSTDYCEARKSSLSFVHSIDAFPHVVEDVYDSPSASQLMHRVRQPITHKVTNTASALSKGDTEIKSCDHLSRSDDSTISSVRSTELKEDVKEYERHRQLLLSISRSYDGIIRPNTRAAIAFMLYRGQPEVVIDLTAAYLFVKLGSIPDGRQVFKKMMELQFDEMTIVELFASYVNTEAGAASLESALALANAANQQTTPNMRDPPSDTQGSSSNQNGKTEYEKDTLTNEPATPVNQQQPSTDGQEAFTDDQLSPANRPETFVEQGTMAVAASNMATTHQGSLSDDSQETVESESENSLPVADLVISSQANSSKSSSVFQNNEVNLTKLHTKLIQKENAMLKDKLLCKLCKQRQISVTLLPCGHFVLCEICSEPCQVCPCCDRVVLAEKKTYLC